MKKLTPLINSLRVWMVRRRVPAKYINRVSDVYKRLIKA